MDRTAEIRGSYTRMMLRHVRRDDKLSTQIYEHLGDQAGAIHDAGRLEWFPSDVHAQVVDDVLALWGRERALTLYSNVLLDAMTMPLMAPLASGAVRMFGRHPASIMRMAPQAWSHIYRNCGHPRYLRRSSDERQACIEIHDLPQEILRSPGTLLSFEANCRAALRYVDFDGRSRTDSPQLTSGTIRIYADWSSAA